MWVRTVQLKKQVIGESCGVAETKKTQKTNFCHSFFGFSLNEGVSAWDSIPRSVYPRDTPRTSKEKESDLGRSVGVVRD